MKFCYFTNGWLTRLWINKYICIILSFNQGLVLNVLLDILFQVVGDQKGAVFGGLVEAPLRPSNKRKYQVAFYSFFLPWYCWRLHFAVVLILILSSWHKFCTGNKQYICFHKHLWLSCCISPNRSLLLV